MGGGELAFTEKMLYFGIRFARPAGRSNEAVRPKERWVSG